MIKTLLNQRVFFISNMQMKGTPLSQELQGFLLVQELVLTSNRFWSNLFIHLDLRYSYWRFRTLEWIRNFCPITSTSTLSGLETKMHWLTRCLFLLWIVPMFNHDKHGFAHILHTVSTICHRLNWMNLRCANPEFH